MVLFYESKIMQGFFERLQLFTTFNQTRGFFKS